MRAFALRACLMFAMIIVAHNTMGQISVQSPFAGIFILPATQEPELAAIEKLLSEGDERALQEWAKSNRFVYAALGDRQAAFFHFDIAYPNLMGWQALLDILNSESPFLLSSSIDARVAPVLKILSRPTTSVAFPNLVETATRCSVAVQRYVQKVAEVQIDNRTLRLLLDEPDRSFDWDWLSKISAERQFPQEPCKLETHPDWKVVIRGSLLTDQEKAQLSTKAFAQLSEALANEQKLIDSLLHHWMETLNHELPDPLPSGWQAWNQLSPNLQELVRSALLGTHLDESTIIDSQFLNSGMLDRVQVRLKMIGGLQLAIRKPGGENYLYQIPLDGGTVTVYTPEALARQQP